MVIKHDHDRVRPFGSDELAFERSAVDRKAVPSIATGILSHPSGKAHDNDRSVRPFAAEDLHLRKGNIDHIACPSIKMDVALRKQGDGDRTVLPFGHHNIGGGTGELDRRTHPPRESDR
jgi:hypothetical protein